MVYTRRVGDRDVRERRSASMFSSILIVCVGNICRSPMAEAMLARRLASRGAIRIGSAGIAALVGRPADPTARALMQERGLDISGHRARQLTPEMAMTHDLILVMDAELKRSVERLVPSSLGRVHRIGRFGDFDVPDPVGRERPVFERALALIERGIDNFQRAFWSDS